jgi:hypothetical protein
MINYNEQVNNQNNITGHSGCKILLFPGVKVPVEYKAAPKIILARPGERMPEQVPDFRSQLHRDGLILLSWDKKLCMNGALYTAYWVTSSGILRYYASPALYIEDFGSAMPNRKSYAAEDGVDFYGDPSPSYMVYVAPELMMSSQEKVVQRPEHIKKLKSMGISVDFDYGYLLKTERNKKIPFPGPINGDGSGSMKGA